MIAAAEMAGSTVHGLHQMPPSVPRSRKKTSSERHQVLLSVPVLKSARTIMPNVRIRKIKVSSTRCSAIQLRRATAAVSQLSPEPFGERKRQLADGGGGPAQLDRAASCT